MEAQAQEWRAARRGGAPGLEAFLERLTRENTDPFPPIEGAQLQEAVRKLTRRKARGLDHWTVEQLQ